MARKKRRKRQLPPPLPPHERPFHAPFRTLKEVLPDAKQDTPPAAETAKPEGSEPTGLSLTASQRRRAQQQEERQLFLAAMADVTPLQPDPRGRVTKRPTARHPRQRTRAEEAVLADLRELVEGRSAFTIQYTDEYMEGVAPGVDQHLAQRLHRGDFAIQAQLDLHGYTVEEAKMMVNRFLTHAYTSGRRCVRLIHGRGHNSKDNRPVLKEHVQLWLSQGRLSRLVLAFATAPVHDGGAGAAYVLLRRVDVSRRR